MVLDMRLYFCSVAILFFLCSCAGLPQVSEAPNREFRFISQKEISPNACGPVSMVNAFGSGSEKWQKLLDPYETSRLAAYEIMRTYGGRPSLTFQGRNRWNKLMGMNLADMEQIMKEMALTQKLVPPRAMTISGLQEVEKWMKTSLRNGLPPILNLSRVAYRLTKASPSRIWDPVGSHSILIVQLRPKVTRKNGEVVLPVVYVDPKDGMEHEGEIVEPLGSSFPSHGVHFRESAQSDIFRSILSSNTKSYLSVTSLLGAF